MDRLHELMGAPYRDGGRDKDGINCLGVVLEVVKAAGKPIPEPLDRMLDVWRQTGELNPGVAMPANWRQVLRSELCYLDLDIIVWLHPPGCGVVLGGKLWTATPEAGVIAQSLLRCRAPDEHWRAS